MHGPLKPVHSMAGTCGTQAVAALLGRSAAHGQEAARHAVHKLRGGSRERLDGV